VYGWSIHLTIMDNKRKAASTNGVTPAEMDERAAKRRRLPLVSHRSLVNPGKALSDPLQLVTICEVLKRAYRSLCKLISPYTIDRATCSAFLKFCCAL
jgi:predicted amidohydrolase